MKKLSKEEFIKKVEVIHNNKHNYSLVEYKNTRTPVKIICPNCGVFEILPHSHLQGIGCAKCNLLTTEKFIKRSNNTHNYIYNYDKVDIIDIKTKVIINCKIHGDFEQRPDAHMKGQGCLKCFKKRKIFTTEEFIKKSEIKHNNLYDYSLSNYKGSKYNIKIICKKHGIFEQSAHHHMNGSKCPRCIRIIDTENFILKAKEIHGDNYSYSKSIYQNRTKICITCNKHGDYMQSPGSHLQGIGCPICSQSKGEKKISNILDFYNIQYNREVIFKNCKNKRSLPFDFYLSKYNTCIEYQGRQHYLDIDFFGGYKKLKYVQNNDFIKEKFCVDNNIKLLIIKYDENIKEKLISFLESIMF